MSKFMIEDAQITKAQTFQPIVSGNTPEVVNIASTLGKVAQYHDEIEKTNNVLPDLVDNSAKNLIDIMHPSNSRLQTIIDNLNGTYTLSGNGTWLQWDVVCYVTPGVQYKFSCDFTNVLASTNGVVVIKDANNTDLLRRVIVEDISVVGEIVSTTNKITIGFSTNNGGTSGAGSFTINPMLCTVPNWNVSQKFEPYAMRNSELTEEIVKLGTKSITVTLSERTFSKSYGGLYYSDSVDLSGSFSEIYAASMQNFNNVKNIAIQPMINGTSLSLTVCDPSEPSALSFTVGTVTFTVFGKLT